MSLGLSFVNTVRWSLSEPLRLALDCDGVVLDAAPRQCAVAAAAIEDLDATALDEARFWQLKREGATTRKALEDLGYDAAVVDRATAVWKQQIEDRRWTSLDPSLCGGATLKDLAGRYRLYLISARQRESELRKRLTDLHVADLFSEIIVVEPESAAAQKAAALSRIRPILFVGDTESDGEAARMAGVPFVAVASGQRSARFLRERGYDVVAGLDSVVHEWP